MQIKFLKFKQKSYRKGGTHASPDFLWSMLQLLALIIVLTSFIFGFFLFQKINKGFTVNADDLNKGEKMISEERINKTLGYFHTKDEISRNIIISPAPFIDPSR